MSVSYFVRYEGRAPNLEAFLSYYRQHHVPILGSMPGLERIVLHAPVESRDPFPVTPDCFLFIVQMIFGSREDLDRALESGARALAREDAGNFPPFEGTVYHQAALSEEIFSK